MSTLTKLKENIESVIVGKGKVIDMVMTSLISNGHILLEDVPGTGKTVMAKSLARSLDASFSRIQFTPDLLPSDVTGLNYYNQKQGEFVFKPGPVFCNILLADEINRATPEPNLPCLNVWRNVKSPLMEPHGHFLLHLLLLQRKTQLRPPELFLCQRHSWIVSL